MLREARIVMPRPIGSLAVHDKLQSQLCGAFGGFTSFRGRGGWKNADGEIVKDYVTIYDVAIDSERDSPSDLIARFAIEAGKALGQDSVYVRYPNGVVDIIAIVRSEKEERAARLAEALSEPRNDTADALAYAFSAGTVDKTDYERRGVEQFLNALFGKPHFVVVADMGDGRSAVEPELPSAEDLTKSDGETKPAEPTKLAPGQLWTTRGGGRAAVGRRATIFGGGFYVTLVDNQPPKYRVGFEYAVNMDGHLVGFDHETQLDLVAHIH